MSARSLGDADLLDLWDRAGALPAIERTGLLAAAAAPFPPGTDVGALPLGQLNAALLMLRARLAGPELAATATCPRCAELVEFGMRISELLAAAGPASAALPLDTGGWHVVWHPPSADDFAAAAAAASPAAAERVLLQRCTESAKSPDGRMAVAADLPGDVRAALAAVVAAADPLAEILADLTCPACQTPFRSEIDIAEFVWAELDAKARRLLLDIALLARAYGWTEDIVLALSERRRAAYVNLAVGGAP